VCNSQLKEKTVKKVLTVPLKSRRHFTADEGGKAEEKEETSPP